MKKLIDKNKLFRQLRGCVKYIQSIKSGSKSGCIEWSTGVIK